MDYFKDFTEFVIILVLFHVLVFWPQDILAPWPGIEPVPPALEGQVLTTGPPGKSPLFCTYMTLQHKVFLSQCASTSF